MEHIHKFKVLKASYERNNLYLAGPYETTVHVTYHDTTYFVTIEQEGTRTITIEAQKSIPWNELAGLLSCVERLLMVFDGFFIPLVNVGFNGSADGDDGAEERSQVFAQRLSYFNTDTCFGIGDKLIEYQQVFTDDLFVGWQHMLDELDIAHQVYLYTISRSGMPVDLRLAYMVELAEPLVEIINTERGLFPSLDPTKRETTLKHCLNAAINMYGDVIFEREMRGKDYNALLRRLVNSRVRIMHIKRKQQQEKYYGGTESVRYMMKLSLLYRTVLLDLLGIDRSLYQERLAKRVESIDAWQRG